MGGDSSRFGHEPAFMPSSPSAIQVHHQNWFLPFSKQEIFIKREAFASKYLFYVNLACKLKLKPWQQTQVSTINEGKKRENIWFWTIWFFSHMQFIRCFFFPYRLNYTPTECLIFRT